jgi:hypothetical protein
VAEALDAVRGDLVATFVLRSLYSTSISLGAYDFVRSCALIEQIDFALEPHGFFESVCLWQNFKIHDRTLRSPSGLPLGTAQGISMRAHSFRRQTRKWIRARQDLCKHTASSQSKTSHGRHEDSKFRHEGSKTRQDEERQSVACARLNKRQDLGNAGAARESALDGNGGWQTADRWTFPGLADCQRRSIQLTA